MAASGSRLEAYDGVSWRTRSAFALASLLHIGFLLVTYLRPLPSASRKAPPILMEVIFKPPPAPPPELREPPPVRHTLVHPPEPTGRTPPPQPQSRPSTPEPASRASVDPAQSTPETPGTTEEPVAQPKGKLNLLPQSLAVIVGAPGIGERVPRGRDRLIHDERLDEPKKPDFELVPEDGGGFRCESTNFTAHIKRDGSVVFDKKFPLRLKKGQPGFAFDPWEWVSRDPYAAEKSRFMEFSEQRRLDLRNKALAAERERALVHLEQQLREILSSGRSRASQRRAIYALWAECSDDAGEVVGTKARRLIEEFVRKSLPASSPEAYTPEELTSYAEQRPGLPSFDPYK